MIIIIMVIITPIMIVISNIYFNNSVNNKAPAAEGCSACLPGSARSPSPRGCSGGSPAATAYI